MRRRRDRGIALAVFPGATSVRPAPATEAVLPRFHFSRLADHAYLVVDRIVDARLVVYLPQTAAQLNGGHDRDLWYVRQAGSGNVNTPQSRPFESFEAAAVAIADGSWDLLPNHADRRPVRLAATR